MEFLTNRSYSSVVKVDVPHSIVFSFYDLDLIKSSVTL